MNLFSKKNLCILAALVAVLLVCSILGPRREGIDATPKFNFFDASTQPEVDKSFTGIVYFWNGDTSIYEDTSSHEYNKRKELEKLQAEEGNVVRVENCNSPTMMKKYKPGECPLPQLFKDGVLVKNYDGAITYQGIMKAILNLNDTSSTSAASSIDAAASIDAASSAAAASAAASSPAAGSTASSPNIPVPANAYRYEEFYTSQQKPGDACNVECDQSSTCLGVLQLIINPTTTFCLTKTTDTSLMTKVVSASKKKPSASEEYYLKQNSKSVNSADCETACDKDEKCTGFVLANTGPRGECMLKYDDKPTSGEFVLQVRDSHKSK